MQELVTASGGKLGQRIGDLAAAATAEKLMSNPSIAKATEVLSSLGGVKGAFGPAQRGRKTAGQKFGKSSDGTDATFSDLGLREEEIISTVKEMVRDILVNKEK